MSDLSPAARELLTVAREQLAPDAAAVARMRSGIAQAVGKSAAASTTGALAVKLGLMTVVAAVAIGAAVYATHASPDAAPRLELPRDRASSATVVVTRSLESPVEIERVAAPKAVQRASESTTATTHAAAPAPVTTRPRAASPGVAASPARADLGREVELIDHAMTALRSGKAAEALAAIRLHALETRGRGQLAEDAAAIEIEAACRLHDPTVAAKLAAFDERYPTSAQRSRMSSSCR